MDIMRAFRQNPPVQLSPGLDVSFSSGSEPVSYSRTSSSGSDPSELCETSQDGDMNSTTTSDLLNCSIQSDRSNASSLGRALRQVPYETVTFYAHSTHNSEFSEDSDEMEIDLDTSLGSSATVQSEEETEAVGVNFKGCAILLSPEEVQTLKMGRSGRILPGSQDKSEDSMYKDRMNLWSNEVMPGSPHSFNRSSSPTPSVEFLGEFPKYCVEESSDDDSDDNRLIIDEQASEFRLHVQNFFDGNETLGDILGSEFIPQTDRDESQPRQIMRSPSPTPVVTPSPANEHDNAVKFQYTAPPPSPSPPLLQREESSSSYLTPPLDYDYFAPSPPPPQLQREGSVPSPSPSPSFCSDVPHNFQEEDGGWLHCSECFMILKKSQLHRKHAAFLNYALDPKSDLASCAYQCLLCKVVYVGHYSKHLARSHNAEYSEIFKESPDDSLSFFDLPMDKKIAKYFVKVQLEAVHRCICGQDSESLLTFQKHLSEAHAEERYKERVDVFSNQCRNCGQDFADTFTLLQHVDGQMCEVDFVPN